MATDTTENTNTREVIVTDNGSGGGFGSALVAIIAILAVLLTGWIAVNYITSDDGEIIPDEITINTDNGSGGGS